MSKMSTGIPQVSHIPPRTIRLALLALFFLSGLSSLVFEVVWIRLLSTILGNTVHATSTVLTAFMAGLALGSYAGGRVIDRRYDPLLVYGALEIGIAVSALGLTFVLDQTGPLSIWLHQALSGAPLALSRYLFSFVLLAVPTTLMGATLPVLARHVTASRSVLGLSLGRLYALNTLGAAAGCFLAGFVLIGSIGLTLAATTAAAVSAAVGAAALLLRSRSSPSPAPDRAAAPDRGSARRTLVLVAFALSGFASLGYEVVWTRVLTRFLGNSVYAFSAMLTTFLVGLALGSLVLSPFVDRLKRRIALLGAVEIAVALYVLLAIFVYSWQLEALVGFGQPAPAWDAPLGRFARAFSLLLLPTFLLGATFPLAARIYVSDLTSLGRNVGVLYSWNTMGAIAGAGLTGFVILPLLGIADAMMALALLGLAIGAALLLAEPSLRGPQRIVAAAALVLVGLTLALTLPRDVFRRAHELSSPSTRLVHHEEGILGTVTVDEYPGHLIMRIDGLDIAGTGLVYESSAKALGHLPMLLHPDPRSAFVLGFGGGSTAHAISTYPTLERIDGAELSSAVLDAAPLLESVNSSILDDPRVHIQVTDGRHALLTSRTSYDVITVDLLWPQTAGTGSLYTREFYEICHGRLADDGILVEWLHPGFIPPEHVGTIIRTMRSVFPHVSLWATRHFHHLVLVASKAPLSVDYTRFVERLSHPPTSLDLSRVGITHPAHMASYFIAANDDLHELMRGSDTLNTDDLPLIEYALPRFTESSAAENRIAFTGIITPPTAVFTGLTPEQKETLIVYSTATRLVAEGVTLWNDGDRASAAWNMQKAVQIAPGHVEAQENLAFIQQSRP